MTSEILRSCFGLMSHAVSEQRMEQRDGARVSLIREIGGLREQYLDLLEQHTFHVSQPWPSLVQLYGRYDCREYFTKTQWEYTPLRCMQNLRADLVANVERFAELHSIRSGLVFMIKEQAKVYRELYASSPHHIYTRCCYSALCLGADWDTTPRWRLEELLRQLRAFMDASENAVAAEQDALLPVS